jgi:hypothetical protein
VVNSPGGHAREGEAIRAAIAAHPGEVTVQVAGIAMSAASLMIMGAARIEMTAGSILMIHDPSDCICGTADDFAQASDRLDTMADVYAGVYAARAGINTAAARAIMRAETFYGPEAAIEAGFADALATSKPEPAISAMSAEMARAAFQTSQAAIMRRVSQSAGSPGRPLANMAHHEEVPMDPEDQPPAGGTPATTPAAAPATTPDPSPTGAAATMTATAPANSPTSTPAPNPDTSDAARMAERARIRDIQSRAAPFMSGGRLSQSDVDTAIDQGLSVEQACARFMTQMAATETAPAPTMLAGGQTARITRDAGETQIEGMIAALMRDYNGPGAQYRGLRLRNLAMSLAGPGRGFNETDAVRQGMMATTIMAGAQGVSDFAYITTQVMNRSLMAEYERRGQNWSLLCGAAMTASDFREIHAVRFGGDFTLRPVGENGEYQQATLADEAEGLKVERRGRTINLTFEAVVNDDMGAFQRIPREFATAARLMEASMVWGLIRTNAALKSDGKALFHTDHKNLAASGGAISVATIGAARKIMWEQTAYGSKAKDDFLMISPDILLVPPALETIAGQFIANTTPIKDADVNPFKSSLTPAVSPHLSAAAGGSDTAWYLISSDYPPITHAYLDGYQAPTVQTLEGMNPDKVTMNARHIFGAAASEFRGAYKNAGA